jgi:hypothetical protein
MRKLAFVVALVALLLTFTPVRADADGHVNFLIGQKSLSDSDAEPFDEGLGFGAMMSFGRTDWPIHIAVDVLGYGDTEEAFGADWTGATFEVAVGVRKIWTVGNTRPYIGGGIGVVGAAVEIDGNGSFLDDQGDGNGFGPWAGGGVFWRLGERFNLGVDVRWNKAEIDLDYDSGGTVEDVNVGGLAYGLTVGFGW